MISARFSLVLAPSRLPAVLLRSLELLLCEQCQADRCDVFLRCTMRHTGLGGAVAVLAVACGVLGAPNPADHPSNPLHRRQTTPVAITISAVSAFFVSYPSVLVAGPL